MKIFITALIAAVAFADDNENSTLNEDNLTDLFDMGENGLISTGPTEEEWSEDMMEEGEGEMDPMEQINMLRDLVAMFCEVDMEHHDEEHHDEEHSDEEWATEDMHSDEDHDMEMPEDMDEAMEMAEDMQDMDWEDAQTMAVEAGMDVGDLDDIEEHAQMMCDQATHMLNELEEFHLADDETKQIKVEEWSAELEDWFSTMWDGASTFAVTGVAVAASVAALSF